MKVLKRIYRLAGLARSRFLRRRALRDILRDPSIIERVCDYMRCTGDGTEYIEFAEELLTHEEQVYPDVNVLLVESLLRVEAAGPLAARVRTIGSRLLRRDFQIPGADDCRVVAPLLLLRFGDKRSLRSLRQAFDGPQLRTSSALIRSAAIVYASYGVDQFGDVRKVASRLLRNNLSETIRFIEQIRRYTTVPDRYKARFSTSYDSVCGIRFVDMRTILTARLLLLSPNKRVCDWVHEWKQNTSTESISTFDRTVIRRLVV